MRRVHNIEEEPMEDEEESQHPTYITLKNPTSRWNNRRAIIGNASYKG